MRRRRRETIHFVGSIPIMARFFIADAIVSLLLVLQLINFIRGPVSEGRMKLVEQAFQALPVSSTGDADVNALTRVFTASNHPDVKASRRNEADVTAEFLAAFKSRAPRSGRITLADFQEYYKCAL